MTKSIVRLLVIASMLGLMSFCAKADSVIRVHLVDARSGLPIANNPVRVWTHDSAQLRNNPGFSQEATDSNGVATFHLKDPIPSYLYVHVGMGARWEECFPDARSGLPTQEILGSGVARESACWKLPNIAGKFHRTPGDVYIFAVHDTFIQRIKALGH